MLQRDAKVVLRTKRPYRRPRRRGDKRRNRFVAPIRLIDERAAEAQDRQQAGHWEGGLIVGAFNRSAIGPSLNERVGSRCSFTSKAHSEPKHFVTA